MKKVATRPVELTESDWEEIYATVEIRRSDIENGDGGPCLEHGPTCTACDIAWIEHLARIMEAIGPDGHDAAERGVAACG